MFTGLIESVGTVEELAPSAAGQRIRVSTNLAAELSPGDSLAVNGVCLTVVATCGGCVHADVSPETLRVTTLGNLKTGTRVNLERSLRADARIGGHFVQGHVDGTGTLEAVRTEGESRWLTIAFPADLAPLLVTKGSVAVDGISLTVADLRPSQFDVMIVPFTWEATNLSTLRAGDRVNLECDLIGKYVARMLQARL